MIKKSLIGRIVGIVLVAISTVSVTVGTLAWFRGAGGETENHIDGEIGLRGYFYDGNGSSKPFEIVDPIHLYNLCRLQNLGLISPGTEFQIGHNKGTVQNPDYKVHDNTSQDGWGYTLDMNGTPITPIGNEATPFESIIKGHGITIKNLDVKGNPEDIGFFGYVGCNGNVSGIILQDIDIYSLGYSSVETEKIYKMFNPNIDPTISTQVDTIFSDSAPYFERFTNVSFVNLSKTPVEESLLTQKNGLPSSAIATEINDVDNYLSPTAAPNNGKKIFNGYFKIVKPSDYLEDASLASQLSLEDKSKIQNDPFKYSYRVSSSLIDEFELVDINDDGSADKALMIDLTKLISAGTASNEFNAPGKNMQVKMRLAIYATFEEKGYKYSRVIQSYSIIFYSNNDKSYYYCSDCDKHYLGSSLVDGKCPEDASHTVSTTPATLYHCTDCDSNYVPTNNSTACPENASHSSSKISPQGYSVSMFCDYVAAADPEHKVTNYHHGNNIGYIAGHVDGTMSYCYVYGSQPHYYCDSCDKSYELGDLVNGHHCPIHTSKTLTQVNNDRYGCNFYLNNTPAGTTPENSKIKTESDIGLIGEVGTSVINTLDPQYGTSGVLNTGVMDFTKIYYGIRSDFATGESANVGHIAVPEANYISYGGENNTGKLNDSDASMFSDYEQYLRYVIINGKKQYISNTMSVVIHGILPMLVI